MNRNHFKLMKSLAGGVFSIHPSAIHAYLPTAVQYMSGELEDEATLLEGEGISPEAQRYLNKYLAFKSESKPFGVSDRDLWYYDNYPVVAGQVVFIPILSAITQEDNCYQAGTKTIMSWYQQAENDPSIIAVVEVMNSPGGEVFGTRSLANFKASMTKPIVGFCEGMQCSAGQYIAAPNNYQFAAPETLIGCIGTMTGYQNFAKYYASKGIEIRELYSKGSPRKNEESRAAAKGDFSLYEDEMLFTFDNSFMGFMKEHRPGISQAALDGATFVSNQAIQEGLIDEIGSLQDAYEKALALANTTTNSITQSNNTQMSEKVRMMAPAGMVGVMKLLGATEVATETTEETTEDATEESEETEEATEVETTEEVSEVEAMRAKMLAMKTQMAGMKKTIAAKSTGGKRSMARVEQSAETHADETPAKQYVTAASRAGGSVKVVEKR
jgi:ClpP class serine protease